MSSGLGNNREKTLTISWTSFPITHFKGMACQPLWWVMYRLHGLWPGQEGRTGKHSCWQPRPLPLGPVSGWGPHSANQVPRVEVKGLQEGELSDVWGSGKQSPSCKAERGERGEGMEAGRREAESLGGVTAARPLGPQGPVSFVCSG